MAWTSPTGHNDPDNKWSDETLAYDGITNTQAGCHTLSGNWSSFIELTNPSADCTKIRVLVNFDAYRENVDIDAYYSAAWHHVYEGAAIDQLWTEIDAELSSFTKIRFRQKVSSIQQVSVRLHELQYLTALSVTTQDPTSVLITTATANGNITTISGNCTVRGFKYGLTKTDTWDVHDDGSFGTGAFTKALTSLTANTIYWIRAYATDPDNTIYGEWVQFHTATVGTTPTGTKINICSDYNGYTYILNSAYTDDGDSYESYFVLSTDLADKQGLHFKKRLLDLFSYFEKKEIGTCKIYIKQDNEATWQYCGEISMTGDEDIIVKHLPSQNEDSSGDIDYLAKHYLIKFVFDCDFDFIGLITESVLIGVR